MQKYKSKYLKGGDIQFCYSSGEITTILGSCVSVILWNPIEKYGGMNHFLHPKKTNAEKNLFLFGDTSTKILINKMIRNGSSLKNIQAMIYGGSHFKSMHNIWSDNIKIAEEILKASNINIFNKNTGGRFGRNILFNTFTGVVECGFISNLGEKTKSKEKFICRFPKYQ